MNSQYIILFTVFFILIKSDSFVLELRNVLAMGEHLIKVIDDFFYLIQEKYSMIYITLEMSPFTLLLEAKEILSLLLEFFTVLTLHLEIDANFFDLITPLAIFKAGRSLFATKRGLRVCIKLTIYIFGGGIASWIYKAIRIRKFVKKTKCCSIV